MRGENGNSEIRHTPVGGKGGSELSRREREREKKIFGGTENSSRLGVPTMRVDGSVICAGTKAHKLRSRVRNRVSLPRDVLI